MKLNLSEGKKINDCIYVIYGNYKEAYFWYTTAKENIESAKILFENCHYSHSIFFLQQSVECLVKGVFLETGVNTTPRNISHAPEKIFIQFYEEVEDDINLNNCKTIINLLSKRNIKGFEDKLRYFTNVINDATNQYHQYFGTSNHLIAQYSYVQNVLFCLSKLFEGTQQDTRYPNKQRNQTILPFDLYNSQIIKERGFSLIDLINEIANIITCGITE